MFAYPLAANNSRDNDGVQYRWHVCFNKTLRVSMVLSDCAISLIKVK